MSIFEHVVLRYRSEGHVRFDLPLLLCEEKVSKQLLQSLRSVEGIYRVDLRIQKQGKLSIRYITSICRFPIIVKYLSTIIQQIVQTKSQTDKTERDTIPIHSENGTYVVPPPQTVCTPPSWIASKLEEVRETFLAASLVVQRGFASLRKRPGWLNEFLNDLVMLYLISLHWHQIVYLWLPHPWRYRYEWAATFYLVYLSVQARLPKPT